MKLSLFFLFSQKKNIAGIVLDTFLPASKGVEIIYLSFPTLFGDQEL